VTPLTDEQITEALERQEQGKCPRCRLCGRGCDGRHEADEETGEIWHGHQQPNLVGETRHGWTNIRPVPPAVPVNGGGDHE